MLFKSAILTQASGSVGGITASRNRAGMYFRARAVPVNPNTAAQVALRVIFGNLATQWNVLTKPQRDAWTTYAINVPVTGKLGDPITLTGQQMYIRNNTARLQAGLPPVDDGPIDFSQDSLSSVSIGPVAATDLLTVIFEDTDGWVDEDDAGLLIYGSRQQGPAINFFKGPYRFAGVILGDNALPPTSPDVTINNAFALDVDNVVFCRAVSVRSDGRISPVQFIGPNIIV